MKYLTELPKYQRLKKQLIAKNDFETIGLILDLMQDSFELGLDKMKEIYHQEKP